MLQAAKLLQLPQGSTKHQGRRHQRLVLRTGRQGARRFAPPTTASLPPPLQASPVRGWVWITPRSVPCVSQNKFRLGSSGGGDHVLLKLNLLLIEGSLHRSFLARTRRGRDSRCQATGRGHRNSTMNRAYRGQELQELSQGGVLSATCSPCAQKY